MVVRRCRMAVGELAMLCLFGGCVALTPPEEFFQLPEESPKYRAMQTRVFDTSDEKKLLSAAGMNGFEASAMARKTASDEMWKARGGGEVRKL